MKDREHRRYGACGVCGVACDTGRCCCVEYKIKCYTRIVELSAMHMSVYMWLYRRQSLSLPVDAFRAHSFGVMGEVVHGGRKNVELVTM